jgi:hypothetical protein
MTEDLKTGQHRNPDSDPGFFTTAYFHDRAGIASEITDSGLRLHDRPAPPPTSLPSVSR